jgi:hypothetical protein
MKISKLIIALVVLLSVATTANAVTLVAGNTYQLSGSITSYASDTNYNGAYTLLNTSSFTVNFDNTISVVLNLLQADGDRAILVIDKLLLGGSGTTLSLAAPAGVKVFPSGCKDIGDFIPVGNPAAYTDFTIAGNGHNINTVNNTLNLLVTSYYTKPGMGFLGRNNVTLNIGNSINTQVPEPMTLSLLGLGLIGGAINRRRKSS